jgi:hypothetical protein
MATYYPQDEREQRIAEAMNRGGFPWKVRSLGDGGIVETADGIQFGRCVSTHAVNMSTEHARLIAAAPELLAALKELADAAEESWPNRPCVRVAKEAIAKAEGK